MNRDFSQLRADQFHPLFAFEGIGYLFTEQFLAQYSKYEIVVVYENNFFRSFISKVGMEKTLQEGYDLFANEEKFAENCKAWEAYLVRAKKVIETYQTPEDDLTVEDWQLVTTTLRECWVYHDKTEFIFTDTAFLAQETNPVIAKSLKRLGEIKFPSSEVLHMLGLNVFYRVAEKIADQFDITHQDIKFFSTKEVEELFSGKKPDMNRIARRKNAYVLLGFDGVVTEPSAEVTALIVDEFRVKASDIKTLRGITASKGEVEGNVRVILADYGSDFRAVDEYVKAMQTGEILVTENTTVQFWPVLQKASAIITNQGGLNSHAAIVAREMKIPCIVGVANATEILKTGERVSLEALGREGVITRVEETA
ncbi:MAG TPA: PEP-utilizing enzyme [Patescibacteria group bacterium]